MSDHVARNGGKAQCRRARPNEFTPAKRQRFLDALAVTCNIRSSAAAAGVDYTTVYYHRVRDAVFGAVALCGLIASGGYEGPGRSPDRADALVWAVTELALGNRGRAGLRWV